MSVHDRVVVTVVVLVLATVIATVVIVEDDLRRHVCRRFCRHGVVTVVAAFVMAVGHLCVIRDVTLDAEVAYGHDKSGA